MTIRSIATIITGLLLVVNGARADDEVAAIIKADPVGRCARFGEAAGKFAGGLKARDIDYKEMLEVIRVNVRVDEEDRDEMAGALSFAKHGVDVGDSPSRVAALYGAMCVHGDLLVER